jgi:hypothetical protein
MAVYEEVESWMPQLEREAPGINPDDIFHDIIVSKLYELPADVAAELLRITGIERA